MSTKVQGQLVEQVTSLFMTFSEAASISRYVSLPKENARAENDGGGRPSLGLRSWHAPR